MQELAIYLVNFVFCLIVALALYAFIVEVSGLSRLLREVDELKRKQIDLEHLIDVHHTRLHEHDKALVEVASANIAAYDRVIRIEDWIKEKENG